LLILFRRLYNISLHLSIPLYDKMASLFVVKSDCIPKKRMNIFGTVEFNGFSESLTFAITPCVLLADLELYFVHYRSPIWRLIRAYHIIMISRV